MELRVFAGWSKSSSMPEVYLHIGSKELDEKIRNKNGMTTENEQKIIDEDKKTLKSRVCAMCNEQNDVGNKFCSKCGQILDIKVIKNIESTKDAIASLLQKDAGFLNKIVNEGVNKRIMELMKIMKL